MKSKTRKVQARCRSCGGALRSIDTRSVKVAGYASDNGGTIRTGIPAIVRRRRFCESCGEKSTTYEIDVNDMREHMLKFMELQRKYNTLIEAQTLVYKGVMMLREHGDG